MSSRKRQRPDGLTHAFTRRSSRRAPSQAEATEAGLVRLAGLIAGGRRVVVVTGAGISHASGIPLFRATRGAAAVWNRHAERTGTRACFLEDPLTWYREFWLPLFSPVRLRKAPNAAHEAVAALCALSAGRPEGGLSVVTQNIDALHQATQTAWNSGEDLVEVHGRAGLYKCSQRGGGGCGDEGGVGGGEGRRTKGDAGGGEGGGSGQQLGPCPYATTLSLTVDQLVSTAIPPDDVSKSRSNNVIDSGRSNSSGSSSRSGSSSDSGSGGSGSGSGGSISGSSSSAIRSSSGGSNSSLQLGHLAEQLGHGDAAETMPVLEGVPTCPHCGSPCMPQALLFDEEYHSHASYQLPRVGAWLKAADAFVFVGTSFAVTITELVIREARARSPPVPLFNVNPDTDPTRAAAATLDWTDLCGKSEAVLPCLLGKVRKLMGIGEQERGGEAAGKVAGKVDGEAEGIPAGAADVGAAAGATATTHNAGKNLVGAAAGATAATHNAGKNLRRVVGGAGSGRSVGEEIT